MRIFILILTFIAYNFLFSQKVEKIYDSISLKIKEVIVYNNSDLVDYKIIYVDEKIIEKIWYDENNKINLRIVYTYSNGILIKRTWYNKKGEITGTSLD
jgi:hypothetical protein